MTRLVSFAAIILILLVCFPLHAKEIAGERKAARPDDLTSDAASRAYWVAVESDVKLTAEERFPLGASPALMEGWRGSQKNLGDDEGAAVGDYRRNLSREQRQLFAELLTDDLSHVEAQIDALVAGMTGLEQSGFSPEELERIRQQRELTTNHLDVIASGLEDEYWKLREQLKPGVYVVGRQLKGKLAAKSKGTHLFLVLVPDPEDANQKLMKPSRQLNDLTRGIVIGAHNIGGRLRARIFEESDRESLEQILNPESSDAKTRQDFEPEINAVELGEKDGDQVIATVLDMFAAYVANEDDENVIYPSLREQFADGCLNSNSWAQSIVEYAVGKGAVSQDFAGMDLCGQNRIPKRYFERD